MSHATNRRIRRRAAKLGGKPMPPKVHDQSWYTKRHTEARVPTRDKSKK